MRIDDEFEFFDNSVSQNSVIEDKRPEDELMRDYNNNCDDNIDYEDMEE